MTSMFWIWHIFLNFRSYKVEFAFNSSDIMHYVLQAAHPLFMQNLMFESM